MQRSVNSNIMRPTSFDPSALRQHLHRNKIADLPELKRVLGTDTDLTVFRKLKQLQYLASYTHRGRFYTLAEIARFDDRGLWSHEGVWFSRYGTLLATLETFVNQSAGALEHRGDHIPAVAVRALEPTQIGKKSSAPFPIGPDCFLLVDERDELGPGHAIWLRGPVVPAIGRLDGLTELLPR